MSLQVNVGVRSSVDDRSSTDPLSGPLSGSPQRGAGRGAGIGIVIVALLALSSIASCSSGKPEPPKIVVDRSACDYCKMLVSDTRYAGAINDGEEKVYDDLGCMFSAFVKMKIEPKYVWVREYEKNVWLDARTAAYVYAPKLGTPMNYGYVAVQDAIAAAQIAGHVDGRVLGNWNAVVTFFKERV